MKFAIPALAAVAVFSSPAQAAVTYYTTQSAFNAATTNRVTNLFEGVPAGDATAYSSGYNGVGFTVKDSANFLYNVDPVYYPAYYDWGSGDVMLFSQNGTVSFTFTNPVSAFSIDLMTIENYAGNMTVAGNGFSKTIATANYPTRTFFGLTSDTALTGFTLTANGGYGEFDNLTLATASTSAVPEPATWAMMLIGFGAVGASMRRRKQVASVKFA